LNRLYQRDFVTTIGHKTLVWRILLLLVLCGVFYTGFWVGSILLFKASDEADQSAELLGSGVLPK
jgi:hypothetical protein